MHFLHAPQYVIIRATKYVKTYDHFNIFYCAVREEAGAGLPTNKLIIIIIIILCQTHSPCSLPNLYSARATTVLNHLWRKVRSSQTFNISHAAAPAVAQSSTLELWPQTQELHQFVLVNLIWNKCIIIIIRLRILHKIWCQNIGFFFYQLLI